MAVEGGAGSVTFLVLLLAGFVGRARFFWLGALATQFWHHFEHAVLLVQRLTETPWFGEKVPTSLVQLLFPRVKLHLFYNGAVFVPMAIALIWHLSPSSGERVAARCGCAWRRFMAEAAGPGG
jgi:hypothetical protein